MPRDSTPSILPASYTLKSSTELCSLWSNYGSISRLTLSHPPTPKTLILKSILPPSTSSDESHLRKLISYRVERYFYTHLSPLLSSLPATKVADAVAINDSTGELLLEDLSVEYPVTCYGSLDPVATTAVLKWLAGFHATFWAPEVSDPVKIGTPVAPPLTVQSPTTTDGIWQRGGYWYLSTRSEELSALLDSDEEPYLIPWINDVDHRIQNEKKQWKTLVHGDVKGANILLSSNPKKSTMSGEDEENEVKAALYDFQYCGIATPAVDLVYFLGTTVDRRSLGDLGALLRTYYDELSKAYEATHGGKKLEDETGYSYDVLEDQWDVAVVDWMRFMAGWGCWGNWRWVKERAQAAVKKWERGGRIPVNKS